MRIQTEAEATRLRRAQQESAELRGAVAPRDLPSQQAPRTPEIEDQAEGALLRGVVWRWHVRRRRGR